MPDGSEFHTAGAASLNPREAMVVRARGTDKGSVVSSVIVWKLVLVTKDISIVMWKSVCYCYFQNSIFKLSIIN